MLLAEQQSGLVLDTLGGSHSITNVSKLSIHMGGSCNTHTHTHMSDPLPDYSHSIGMDDDWSGMDVSTKGAAVAYYA